MHKIDEFEKTLTSFYSKMSIIPREYTSIQLDPEKWTLKQIIGHLIDSAANNHQRFVRLQEGNLYNFPGYNQIEWIQIQNYNEFEWNKLIELWRLYNLLLIHVIKNINPSSNENIWETNGEKNTLEFIVDDYFSHLKWHIEQFDERAKEINDSES